MEGTEKLIFFQTKTSVHVKNNFVRKTQHAKFTYILLKMTENDSCWANAWRKWLHNIQLKCLCTE